MKVGKPAVESGVAGVGRLVLAGVVKNHSKMGIDLNIERQVRGMSTCRHSMAVWSIVSTSPKISRIVDLRFDALVSWN